MATKEYLRKKIITNLARYGVRFDSAKQILLTDDIREMQSKLAEQTNARGLKYKNAVAEFFAKPEDINILKVSPCLQLVETEAQRRIWAYAASFWSIPITTGYGRRIRFLVFDRQNDKLIGLVGLADPIIGLGIRDDFIGWNKDQKMKRLYNCMTAYILGAVPPYNLILGSKLVALTLLFPEVREIFHRKYKNKTTIISEEVKKPYLVYVDTLGAFGKSAIYNRLLNWDFVGYSKGQSHLHITANGSWEMIKQLVPRKVFNTYKFGQGPNWKMRILKAGLRKLGFSDKMLSIGWQRGYYGCPLAQNWKEFLVGESNRPIWKNYKKEDLVEYWKERWVIPRLDKLKDRLIAGVE